MLAILWLDHVIGVETIQHSCLNPNPLLHSSVETRQYLQHMQLTTCSRSSSSNHTYEFTTAVISLPNLTSQVTCTVCMLYHDTYEIVIHRTLYTCQHTKPHMVTQPLYWPRLDTTWRHIRINNDVTYKTIAQHISVNTDIIWSNTALQLHEDNSLKTSHFYNAVSTFVTSNGYIALTKLQKVIRYLIIKWTLVNSIADKCHVKHNSIRPQLSPEMPTCKFVKAVLNMRRLTAYSEGMWQHCYPHKHSTFK